MKIRPLGFDLFHADGRRDGHTEMTKLTDDFRNFATAHKNIQILQSLWRRGNQS